MPTIDDLTPVLASAVANTDLVYVGLPLNVDPDRHMLVSEAKTLFMPDDGVTNLKLRDGAPLSVIGRAGNTTGDPADIAAATDGHVLRRSGTALGFGTVSDAGIAAGVDAGKIANGTVSNTEFQYLDGVTSPIQTQLGALTSTTISAGTGLTGGGSLAANRTISHAAHTGDVTGTTALSIAPKAVTAGKLAVAYYAGNVSSAGSGLFLPADWTALRTSDPGVYLVTHNLGTALSNSAVIVTPYGSSIDYSAVVALGTNNFTVRTFNATGTLANISFSFLLITSV